MEHIDNKAMQHITIVNHYYYYGKCCDKCTGVGSNNDTPVHHQKIFTTTGADPGDDVKIQTVVKSQDNNTDIINPLLKFFPNLNSQNNQTNTSAEKPKKQFTRFQSEKYIKKPYNHNKTDI
jgi:hypothetical protein